MFPTPPLQTRSLSHFFTSRFQNWTNNFPLHPLSPPLKFFRNSFFPIILPFQNIVSSITLPLFLPFSTPHGVGLFLIFLPSLPTFWRLLYTTPACLSAPLWRPLASPIIFPHAIHSRALEGPKKAVIPSKTIPISSPIHPFRFHYSASARRCSMLLHLPLPIHFYPVIYFPLSSIFIPEQRSHLLILAERAYAAHRLYISPGRI